MRMRQMRDVCLMLIFLVILFTVRILTQARALSAQHLLIEKISEMAGGRESGTPVPIHKM